MSSTNQYHTGAGGSRTEHVMEELGTSLALHFKLVIGIVSTIVSCILFIYVLVIIERNYNSLQEYELEEDNVGSDTILQVETTTPSSPTTSTTTTSPTNTKTTTYDLDNNTLDDEVQQQYTLDQKDTNNNISMNPDDLRQRKYRKLLTTQRVVIGLQVMVLTLINYLLLVYLPGSDLLSFIGVVVVWTLTLQRVLFNEVHKQQRIDRILLLISLFLSISGGLTLCTYSTMSMDGQSNVQSMYVGPAYILGYDMHTYNNTDGQTLRSNLVVYWGGSWGCPHDQNKYCTGTINGTLCQTKYSVDAIQKQYEKTLETELDYVEKYEEEEIEAEQVDDILLLKNNQTNAYEGDISDFYDGNVEVDVIGSETYDENGSLHQHIDAVDIDFENTNEELVINTNDKVTNKDGDNEPEVEFMDSATAKDESDISSFTFGTNDSTNKKNTGKNMTTANSTTTTTTTNTQTAKNTTESSRQNGNRFVRRTIESGSSASSTTKSNNSTTSVAEKVAEQVINDEADIENEEEYDETTYYNEVANEVVAIDESYEDSLIDLQSQIDLLKNQHTALVNENEQLQQEYNEMLKQLNVTEFEDEELTEEINDIGSEYGSNDDYYSNDYWYLYEWDSIWGEFQCDSLYRTDISELSIPDDVPPQRSSGGSSSSSNSKAMNSGSSSNIYGLRDDDDGAAMESEMAESKSEKEANAYPTINIYGSCYTCQADLQDHYSTEHYEYIMRFQKQSRCYFLLSFGTFLGALFFYVNHLVQPKNDNKMELLDAEDNGTNHHHNQQQHFNSSKARGTTFGTKTKRFLSAGNGRKSGSFVGSGVIA